MLDFLLRFVADAALWCVYDPLERQIIIGADDNAEIGHRIANFHTLIKSWAANDAIRQAYCQKPIFKGPHLVAGPYQNRHVIQSLRVGTTRAALDYFDLFPDPTRFFFSIPMADQAHFFTVIQIGPKPFS